MPGDRQGAPEDGLNRAASGSENVGHTGRGRSPNAGRESLGNTLHRLNPCSFHWRDRHSRDRAQESDCPDGASRTPGGEDTLTTAGLESGATVSWIGAEERVVDCYKARFA